MTTIKIHRVDAHAVTISTPDRGLVPVTWADLRESARDYGDGLDATVSVVYRALLAGARERATALSGERVEVDGLYVGPVGPVGTADQAACEQQWAARVERDYCLPPSVVVGCSRVVRLDPDQLREHRTAVAAGERMSAEIARAAGYVIEGVGHA